MDADVIIKRADELLPGDAMDSGWGTVVDTLRFHDVVVVCWRVTEGGNEWSQAYGPDAAFQLAPSPKGPE